MTATTAQPSSSTPHPRALVVEGLCVMRSGHTILRDVSFRVARGEALILTGPNGAGKSTLLRALAGFLRPAAGRVRVDGGEADVPVAQCCHVCGHLDGIKAQLTVRENLAFWAAYLGGANGTASVDARIDAALTQFRLQPLADVPAAFLSAGQKRRLGLGRLLVATRPVWLLDEPTVSLDKASVALLLAVMRRHLGDGGIIVAATHLDMPLPGARELQLGRAVAEADIASLAS